jgi:prepilin signal peptidase PulO-like enzyme (type II secretory pathway)
MTDVMGTTAILGHGLLAALMAGVIWYDLKFMRLPNLLVLMLVVVFAATVAWTLPLAVLGVRVGVGLAVLVLGAMANAAKLLEGGDVKVLRHILRGKGATWRGLQEGGGGFNRSAQQLVGRYQQASESQGLFGSQK